MAEEVKKERDVNAVVRHLIATFNKSINPLERAFRSKTSGPNLTYRLETDFAYLLNEVVQGPRAMLQTNITACNSFIDETLKKVNALQQEKQAK